MKIDKIKLKILQILKENVSPISSNQIALELEKRGIEISERTIRYYLLQMDREKLTSYIDKKGRILTEFGKSELENSYIAEKIGFLSSKIDKLTYKMDFNLKKLTGKIVVNISYIEKKDFSRSIPLIMKVFESGYAMGELLFVFDNNNDLNLIVPENCIGIATVCSITLNGILLSYGIPVRSKYGGLLELVNGKPYRFVALINYDGTTIDPLEIFIKSKMTDYIGATASGNGLIGASFREVPADARDKIVEISERVKKVGLNGFMEIGYNGESVKEIPVNEGMIGLIIIGGLNPMAILEEYGINVISKAMSGLLEYSTLFHYKELPEYRYKFNM